MRLNLRRISTHFFVTALLNRAALLHPPKKDREKNIQSRMKGGFLPTFQGDIASFHARHELGGYMKKRVIALLMAVVTIFGMLAVPANAASLKDSGTVTIQQAGYGN